MGVNQRGFSEFASRSLADADARAERLLGWVRMAVAVVLAIVILSATGANERPDDPVLDRRLAFAVVGMICYFLVGLFVVLYVRRGRQSKYIAWLTAVADVSLISWNVFGVVHFSEISPLYALAFPSSLMVPLILAFGALRFRPGVQVFATLLTALLISLILFSDPGMEMDPVFLARQLEITYGVPPNIIRVLMILAVGLIIAVAVYRAKVLLENTVTEAEEKANLSRFLPKYIARDMNDSELDRLKKGRRQQLGLVFIDIRNFTEFAESTDPAALAQQLQSFRGQIVDIAENYGGILDKFIGDGALLLFGLKDDAQGAADATIAASEALARCFADSDIRVGVGAHLGEVFVGAIGDDRRLEFTVIGAEVNLAARIEQMTKTLGHTLLASETLVLTATKPGQWERIGQHEIRGVSQPVALWTFPGLVQT